MVIFAHGVFSFLVMWYPEAFLHKVTFLILLLCVSKVQKMDGLGRGFAEMIIPENSLQELSRKETIW